MGLAIEGNNIGICKACIKDADSLKDLTLPPLVRKTGSGAGNLVSLKVILEPGASFAPY
jgi:hypothetical protein